MNAFVSSGVPTATLKLSCSRWEPKFRTNTPLLARSSYTTLALPGANWQSMKFPDDGQGVTPSISCSSENIRSRSSTIFPTFSSRAGASSSEAMRADSAATLTLYGDFMSIMC